MFQSDGVKGCTIIEFQLFFFQLRVWHVHTQISTKKIELRTGSTQKNVGISGFWGTVRMDSGLLRVARGGYRWSTTQILTFDSMAWGY